MMIFIKNKITSDQGETIAEVLIASLVIALGMILFVTMVNASFKILVNEDKHYREFVESKNAFELVAESTSGAETTVNVTTDYYGVNKTLGNVKPVIVYSKAFEDITFYRYVPKTED